MRVYVNDSTRLAELRADLLEARCLSETVGDNVLDVVHPPAHDEREELIELTFFLRAWQAIRPDARVELVRP